MHYGDAKLYFLNPFRYRQRIRIKLCVVPLVSGDAREWLFLWGFSSVSSSVVPNGWDAVAVLLSRLWSVSILPFDAFQYNQSRPIAV